jgi:anti-sigma B factor antagonist
VSALVEARFEVTRSEDGPERLRFKLGGELDLYSATALDDAIVKAEGEKWPCVCLDLSELDFLDSAGLRVIMRTHARSQKDGRRLVLRRGPEAVDRVFRLTRLDRELEWDDEPAPVEPA